MLPMPFRWLALCLFTCTKLWPQDSLAVATDSIQPTTMWQTLKYDGASIYGGVKHAYLAPLHWKEDNWAAFGGIVVGTGMLWMSDEAVGDYFLKEGEHAPELLKDGGFYFGKPLYNYGITGSIYFYGLLTKNVKVRKTGVLIITSATAAGVLQSILKNGVGRARPGANMGSATFKPFSKEEAYHSFPSGHAILSFTTAYAISKQFSNPWVKTGICALGLITPVSRMWEGAHWISDVGVGIALSVATVESVDRYLNQKRNYDPIAGKKKISWNLRLTNKTVGIVGNY